MLGCAGPTPRRGPAPRRRRRRHPPLSRRGGARRQTGRTADANEDMQLDVVGGALAVTVMQAALGWTGRSGGGRRRSEGCGWGGRKGWKGGGRRLMGERATECETGHHIRWQPLRGAPTTGWASEAQRRGRLPDRPQLTLCRSARRRASLTSARRGWCVACPRGRRINADVPVRRTSARDGLVCARGLLPCRPAALIEPLSGQRHAIIAPPPR